MDLAALEAVVEATINANATHTIWDMGNGDTVRCTKGMKHPAWAVRNEASPHCGYMYEREGIYPVSVTAYWSIDWTGIGQTGTLTLDLTRSDELLIGEIQVVNVPIRDR